ncbi:hypothetical protein WJX79_010906 [Trebouxia sp. C0005]
MPRPDEEAPCMEQEHAYARLGLPFDKLQKRYGPGDSEHLFAGGAVVGTRLPPTDNESFRSPQQHRYGLQQNAR